MNHLAELCYQALRSVVAGSNWPLITYSQLLDLMPRSYQGLSPREPELHLALGEIAAACRKHHPPLPILTAVVVRSETLMPGRRYFEFAHPELEEPVAKIDKWRIKSARKAAWQSELSRVSCVDYPLQLESTSDVTDVR